MKKRTLTILVIAALLMFVTGCGEKEEAAEATTVEITAEEVVSEATETEPVELIPVETTIETGTDFDALETLEVGTYQISGTLSNVTLDVYEVDIKNRTEISAKISDGTVSETVDSPVLIKTGEDVYLYGKVDYRRSLERVRVSESLIFGKEENVVWTDFPSQEVEKCAGPYNNGFATLGETQNPDGTWHYAIYSKGEELAGIDLENRLRFRYDEGVAVSYEGTVYLLYYTANSMEAYEVELPEKVDEECFAYIDDTYEPFYGYVQVYVDGNEFYVIKTAEHEALVANGLDYIDRVSEPLSKKPTYTVIKGRPENFDRFETWFGGDAQRFGMNCYMDNEEYSFRYDMYLKDEIERHYLIQFIPEEELAQVWCKEYTSYSEVEKAIKELNEFLKNWEEKNLEMILETYESDMEYWDDLYPEMLFQYYG